MAGKLSDVSTDLDAPIQPGEFLDEVNPEAAERLFKAIVLESLKDACAVAPRPVPKTGFLAWSRYVGFEIPKRSKARAKKKAWDRYVTNYNSRCRKIASKRDKARSWLLSGGRDFDILCQFAGWDPDYIRSGAKKLEAANWPQNVAEAIAA